MIRPLFISLMLVVVVPSTTAAASFDCDRAATETEIAICSDPELSALDELLGELWASREREPYEVKLQANWLARRNACEGRTSCIAFNYNTHLEALTENEPFQIETLYRWRLVELKFGCVNNLSVSEITDDLYPQDELREIVVEANRYFDCMVGVISDPNLTASEFASLYRGLLYTLDWFPDAFMYPISERRGHLIYASFAEEPIRLNQVLLQHVYQRVVITHLNQHSRIAQQLIENQNEWRRYNERTCTAPIYTSINTYNGNSGGGYRCTNIGIEARILQLSAWIGGFEDYGYPDGSISQVLNLSAQPADMPRQSPSAEHFSSLDEMVGMAEKYWLYENGSQYNRGLRVEPQLLNKLINLYWKLRSEHAGSTVSDVSAQISRAHLFDLLGVDVDPSRLEPAASVFGSLVNFYRRYEQYLRPLLVQTLRSDALVTDARNTIELFLFAYNNEAELPERDFLIGFWNRRAADGTEEFFYDTFVSLRSQLR